MNIYKRLASLLLLLSLSLPAVALNLNEAMSALGDAKASGQLGEMPNGYLGVVSAGGQAAEIAAQVADVVAFAGRSAGDRVLDGLVNSSWVTQNLLCG